jgi:GT2 family glycosyltransferase
MKDAPSEPTVSALVVNWNGKHLLEKCLSSVLESGYANLEIIVLDCGSSDGSAEFVKQNFSNVRVVEFEVDPGVDHAYIVGAGYAKGDYILLLNNDVLIERGSIKKMVEAADDGNTLLVPREADWEGHISARIGAYRLALPLYLLYKTMRKTPRVSQPFVVCIACAMIGKDIFLENPPNEHVGFYEELEWCWRLQLCNVNLRVLEDVRFLHKGAATTRETLKAAYYSGRNNIAAHFVCAGALLLAVSVAILPLYYVLRCLIYISKRRFDCLGAFLHGVLDFFKDIRLFWHDRAVTQKKRQISDLQVFKQMIASCHYVYSIHSFTPWGYVRDVWRAR